MISFLTSHVIDRPSACRYEGQAQRGQASA